MKDNLVDCAVLVICSWLTKGFEPVIGDRYWLGFIYNTMCPEEQVLGLVVSNAPTHYICSVVKTLGALLLRSSL